MRVGIFTDGYEPHTSGVTTSIKMLKSALEGMKHEVYIVAVNLESYKFVYDEENKIIRIPGVKTGIYNTRLTSIYSRKAMKIIKSWNLDVIHSQTEFGVGTFSRIVAKRLKLPVVHTYHTLYEDYVYYVTHGHFDKLGKKVAIQMTKYFCEKNCDELVVPTDKIKDLFLDKYGIKREINVIPTGIDTQKFEDTPEMEKKIDSIKKKYKIGKEDFIVGSVGRIAQEKSFDVQIKAMKPLVDKDPSFKMFIVGDGPELGNLKKLVKSLDMEKNVFFTGLVPYSEVPIYLNLFDVMTSFSRTETQGLTIIEGLSASTPVVCIDDESFREMVQDKYNGYLFKNDAEFRNDVMRLKNNKDLYDEMVINAKNSIHKYSKEVFAADILKVYSKAIMKNKIKYSKED
ncbi:MAG TPA: glycosyl transferase family 1 [Firmicutes bacterium]|nr:glycosyl transferase family 1 [Bacillota bacterium]